MANGEIELVKKGHSKDTYTKEQLAMLMRSMDDPVYFTETFVKIQHPTKGSINFQLFDYQREMIRAFAENRFVIGLTARQMGKSNFYTTKIRMYNSLIEIGDLVKPVLSIKEKIVSWLENRLHALAIYANKE